MVGRLALQDLHFHWWRIAIYLVVAAFDLLILGFGPPGDVIGTMLFVTACVFCAHLPVTVVEPPTFVMSLPISVREYAAGKILANLLMFLIPWAALLAGSILLIFCHPAMADGLIPWAVLLLFTCLAGYCLVLGIGLLAESPQWTLGTLFFVLFLTNAHEMAEPHLFGPAGESASPAFTGQQLELLAGLVAAIVLILGLAFYLRSRRGAWLGPISGKRRRGRKAEVAAAAHLAGASVSSWSLVRRLVLRDFFVNRRSWIYTLFLDLAFVLWPLLWDKSAFDPPITQLPSGTRMLGVWLFAFHAQLIDNLRVQRAAAFSAMLPVGPRTGVVAHLLSSLLFFLLPWTALLLTVSFYIGHHSLPGGLIPYTILQHLGTLAGYCVALGLATFGQSSSWTARGMYLGLGFLFVSKIGIQFSPGIDAAAVGNSARFTGFELGWLVFLLAAIVLSLALPLSYPHRRDHEDGAG